MNETNELLYVTALMKPEMNLTRYSRQLFPLVLGNSRTAFLMAGQRHLSLSRHHSKEEHEMELKQNPYFLKYADKIKKLKETNPNEYYKRLEKMRMEPINGSNTESSESELDNFINISSTSEKRIMNEKKKTGLDAIMKVEMLKDKTAAEISDLWKQYYQGRDAVFAVIPSQTYSALHKLMQENPSFIYPIPRQDGHEMFLGQVAGTDCNFTSLSLYQKHGEHAPVQLVLRHFTELKESKGIVLMSGSVADQGISITDAQLLSYQIQYFYNSDNYHLVKEFNTSPQSFDYNRVIHSVSDSLLAKNSTLRK